MRTSSAVAATFLACLAAAILSTTSAQDPYSISLVPVLLPWPADNSTMAYQGASAVAELNLARIFLGPCAYRMMHLHIYADEVFILVSGRVESVMVAPNNTIYTHSLVAGDNVVYPKGWMHYQYNPTCKPGLSTIVFNAKAIGSVNIPLSLAKAPDAYLRSTYNVKNFPEPAGLWVVDAKCAKDCKL